MLISDKSVPRPPAVILALRCECVNGRGDAVWMFGVKMARQKVAEVKMPAVIVIVRKVKNVRGKNEEVKKSVVKISEVNTCMER